MPTLAQQRDVGREQLGDAAAVRGRVDVQDPGALQRFGQLADAFDASRADDVRVVVEVLVEKRDTFEHGELLEPTMGDDEREAFERSIYCTMPRAVACPDKFRGTLTCRRGGGGDGRRACAAPGSTTCVELPLADGGEGTLDALLAARGGSRRTAPVTGPLGDPVDAEWARAARRRRGRRDGAGERARAGRRPATIRCARRTRGTGELIAAARARRRARGSSSRVGGSATTDGGLGRGRGARLVARTGSTSRSRATSTTPFLDAARGLRAAEGRDGRAGRAADPPARAARRAVPGSGPASTSRELEGGGAAGGLAGGLAAIGARLEPGFDVVAEAVGLEAALDGADLVVTGEGKLDATSLEGKVVGGVLEWAADARRPARRGDRGSGHRRGARRRSTRARRRQVLALTDRVWQAGEAFARAGAARRGSRGRSRPRRSSGALSRRRSRA